eukprot:GFYU01001088.1.p1 GENE.GFYU01001088.1~~GFYU01001088.1.p1  ORF type:complete len:737 (+),score=205.96 GFYU01001088.1:519-2729(+)
MDFQTFSIPNLELDGFLEELNTVELESPVGAAPTPAAAAPMQENGSHKGAEPSLLESIADLSTVIELNTVPTEGWDPLFGVPCGTSPYTINVYRNQDKGVTAFVTEIEINGSVNTVASMIRDVNQIVNWFPSANDSVHFRLVDTVGDNHATLYVGAGEFDYVVSQHTINHDAGTVIVYDSVSHPSEPVTPYLSRGLVLPSGFSIEATGEGSCRVKAALQCHETAFMPGSSVSPEFFAQSFVVSVLCLTAPEDDSFMSALRAMQSGDKVVKIPLVNASPAPKPQLKRKAAKISQSDAAKKSQSPGSRVSAGPVASNVHTAATPVSTGSPFSKRRHVSVPTIARAPVSANVNVNAEATVSAPVSVSGGASSTKSATTATSTGLSSTPPQAQTQMVAAVSPQVMAMPPHGHPGAPAGWIPANPFVNNQLVAPAMTPAQFSALMPHPGAATGIEPVAVNMGMMNTWGYNPAAPAQAPTAVPEPTRRTSSFLEYKFPAQGQNGLQFRPLNRGYLIWTSELHKKFLAAVKKLGIDSAKPQSILNLMKVQGLTTTHIKSHLQKFRARLKKNPNALDEDMFEDPKSGDKDEVKGEDGDNDDAADVKPSVNVVDISKDDHEAVKSPDASVTESNATSNTPSSPSPSPSANQDTVVKVEPAEHSVDVENRTEASVAAPLDVMVQKISSQARALVESIGEFDREVPKHDSFDMSFAALKMLALMKTDNISKLTSDLSKIASLVPDKM